MSMKIALIICCFLIAFGSSAQTPKAIEGDLLKSFKRIDYCIEKRYTDTSFNWVTNLFQANKDFGNKLKSYTEKVPLTITFPFISLKKEMNISTSNDGLFRIYSWDTQTGGTMHFFENVFQYKVGANTLSILDTPKTDVDARPNYYKISIFKANNKTYYLAVYLSIGSTKDVADGVRVFTIENGKLIDAKLIKTDSGLHSELSYWYNFFSVVNIAFEKRPTIRFDRATNIIRLPLIDNSGNMTNKHILYKFTGQYFERVEN